MPAQLKAILVKAREGVAQLPHLGRALRLVWSAAPGLTFWWAVVLFVQGLLPVGVVTLTRSLVDSVVALAGAGGGWARLRQPLLLAALMALLLLLSELLQAAARWIRAAQAELVRDHMSGLVHAKALAADLAYYESAEYFDQLHRIRYDVQERPLALLENVGGIMQSALTLAAMVAVLLRFGVWIPVALLLSTLPALWVVVAFALRRHEWRMRTTEDERRAYYYDWVMTSREHAAEVRLFRLGTHFSSLFAELRRRLRRERLELARAEGIAGLVAGSLALLIAGAALGLMVWRALAREVSLGDLAMFYQAFSQGQRLLRTLLENLGQIYSNTLFLGNLFDFLILQPAVVTPAQPQPLAARVERGIAFRGVTFAYPGSDKPVLRSVDLDLPAGRVVAVVGANGAGKSTLVKLLCRLYDPQEGRIELDGKDLRTLSLDELRRRITVLFQEPSRFAATVRSNVAVGDIEAPHGDEPLGEALAASGATELVKGLPRGVETELGRWFAGGTELSVGEWQRLALARAFFRQAPIVLLDEPTSALDSWSENEWMNRFRALVSGRTALIITHRFTTAMRADVIHVLHEGRIVESGTHSELLRLGGRYAASWTAQMRQAAQSGNPGSTLE